MRVLRAGRFNMEISKNKTCLCWPGIGRGGWYFENSDTGKLMPMYEFEIKKVESEGIYKCRVKQEKTICCLIS